MSFPKTLLDEDEIQRFIDEDVGKGDITTLSTIDPEHRTRGVFLAKEDFILAGIHESLAIIHFLDTSIEFKTKKDGEAIKKGDEFCEVRGNTQALLIGERPALNLLQRLSAIATLSRKYADAAGEKLRIVDTRKTTPGLRVLEKYAVRVGGCHNHRMGLDDGILIKDNHIRAAGGITNATRRAREFAHHLVKIEVEVTNLEELKEAIEAGADGVLLDNMDTPALKEAVKIAGDKVFTEASGGITFERIPELLNTGLDFASVGALTHSVNSVDISFEIEI